MGAGARPARVYEAGKLPPDLREVLAHPDLTPLLTLVESWGDACHPTKCESARLYDAAFLHLEHAVALGGNERIFKDYQVDWLWKHAPGLASNKRALRKAYVRALRRWRSAGRKLTALFDQRRRQNRARRAPPLPKADLDLIVGCAVLQHDGRLLPAWRQIYAQLSEVTRKRYANRMKVPRRVHQEAMPEIRRAMPFHIGPRTARLNGCYLERDWSGVFAGDWFTSDDVTLPVYWYLPEKPEELIRGQFLPMCDLRSERVLDFLLVAEPAYSAADIRLLISRVCRRYGLPRVGFAFESGIWKRAKLVGGRACQGAGEDCGETFADRLGLRITHSIPGNARAKVIERVIGILQEAMAGEPGFVGRDEMHIKYERVRQAMLEVQSGRKHPAEVGFYSLEQWLPRLQAICEEYNATPRESAVMGGRMCPNEAWEALQRRLPDGTIDPVVKLPPELDYLLSAHRQVLTVGRGGISLFGGKYRYASEVTGARQGETVVCWWDPETPDFITITDLHGDRAEVVPRCPKVRATDGWEVDEENTRFAAGLVAAHNGYRVRRYSELKAAFMPPSRVVVTDPGTLERARQIQEARRRADRGVKTEDPSATEEFQERLRELRVWEEEHRLDFL